MPLKRRRLPV